MVGIASLIFHAVVGAEWMLAPIAVVVFKQEVGSIYIGFDQVSIVGRQYVE